MLLLSLPKMRPLWNTDRFSEKRRGWGKASHFGWGNTVSGRLCPLSSFYGLIVPWIYVLSSEIVLRFQNDLVFIMLAML